MTYRMASSPCPNCGKTLDTSAPISGGRAPEPDDFSLCLYCGHLCVFDAKMRRRAPTDEELIDAADHVELVLAQRMQAYFAQRKARTN